jgi:hypothetical protein
MERAPCFGSCSWHRHLRTKPRQGHPQIPRYNTIPTESLSTVMEMPTEMCADRTRQCEGLVSIGFLLCHVMLCHVMPCYAMLCYAALRYAVLPYAMMGMFCL